MFERAVDLLAEPGRQVYVIGGGAAQPLAAYFALLAQYYRDDLRLLDPNPGSFGHQLAGARADAVLVCVAYHRCRRSRCRRCGSSGASAAAWCW